MCFSPVGRAEYMYAKRCAFCVSAMMAPQTPNNAAIISFYICTDDVVLGHRITHFGYTYTYICMYVDI